MVCSSCSCSSCWVREVSLTTIIGSEAKIVYWSLQAHKERCVMIDHGDRITPIFR